MRFVPAACCVPAFIIRKVSPQAPHLYQTLLFAAVRIAVASLFVLLPLIGTFFLVGDLTFGRYRDFGFRVIRADSAAAILQNLQPLHETPPIAALPADDGLADSRPSSSRYPGPSAVCTTKASDFLTMDGRNRGAAHAKRLARPEVKGAANA